MVTRTGLLNHLRSFHNKIYTANDLAAAHAQMLRDGNIVNPDMVVTKTEIDEGNNKGKSPQPNEETGKQSSHSTIKR